jgi:hypothetical protein
MGRIIGFLFGLVAYAVFLGTFLYAIGFVCGVVVPKTIDSGPAAPVPQALIIDILLMSLFAVQHSVMARNGAARFVVEGKFEGDGAGVGRPGFASEIDADGGSRARG